MMTIKLAWKFFKGKKFLDLSNLFAILGLSMGITCLIVAMALVSGYESTFKETVFDSHSHMVLSVDGKGVRNTTEFFNSFSGVWEEAPPAYTPYVKQEGLIASKGKITGIHMEGVDLPTINNVSNLKNRVIEGRFLKTNSLNEVLIGKEIASSLNIKVGDSLPFIIPQMSELAREFSRKVFKLKVVGIIDLGKFEANRRITITNIEKLREIFNYPPTLSRGLRLKFVNPDFALKYKHTIQDMDSSYFVRTWYDIHYNIFNIIKYEKKILFFILSLIILISCFNVSSSLFIHCLKRYPDISVLKAIGLRPKIISNAFVAQGLFIACIGFTLALFLSFGLVYVIEGLLTSGLIIPPEVYKISSLKLKIIPNDLIAIFFITLIFCIISAWLPALKARSVQPTEGLRYE